VALTFEQTRQLFDSGRYLDIIKESGYLDRQLSTLQPEHRVLLAYAMFQAGRADRAREIVERERERATGIIRSRCELLSGMLCRHSAHLGKALQHFNIALQMAREEKSDLDTAWAALHRFRLLAQLHPSDELAPMLAEVRRCVARAGDAHAAAHMHDAVALMEASNGRPDEARRHLEISQSLIRAFPNAGLEQVVLISTSFVDFYEGRFQSAIDSLNAARRLASVTGSRDAGVIECNLGHATLVLGRLESAEAFFKHVVEHGTTLSRFGALEGLARVYLAAGEFTRCAETLEEHESFLLQDRNLVLSLSGRWTAATRVRLLLRQNHCAEAVETAKSALESAKTLSDRILVNELTCLLAEAQVRSGDATAAAKQLVCLLTHDPIQSGKDDAMYYRTLGCVVSDTAPTISSELLRRARNIYALQGNKAGEAELEPLVQRTIAPNRDANDVPLLLLSGIASALTNADSPKLVARELTQVAKLLGCSPNTELIHCDGPDTAVGDQHALLRLGIIDGRHTALRFQVPSRAHDVAALSELMRVGAGTIAVHTFRKERRQRAALWPADPVEMSAGALFLAEEMQTLLATARRVAATNVPILITGETGTGKEVLARAIHAYSTRSKAAFLPFNCTSTPRDMLDSQLFGHRRGSFTGAIENFQGIIRGASGGTLFLDEIGDMSLEVQPKLLRFLESGEVHPVGATQPVKADVRVIAATNANLDALVSDGRFREDLFYRLNIVHLPIPPLRERRIEIPALAHHYLEKYASEYAKGNLRLAEETMEYLVLYRWPGNVRQLANEMRRMAALCEAGAVIMPEHLSPAIAASRRTIPASERTLDPTEVVVRLDQPLAAATEHLERAMLQHALKECGGRMEETAARLGLSRKGLYLKRQRFGIEPPESAAVSV
jgi:DNA-binding NtrC family response regulator/tetratricopeptide (TPR) repeat protein